MLKLQSELSKQQKFIIKVMIPFFARQHCYDYLKRSDLTCCMLAERNMSQTEFQLHLQSAAFSLCCNVTYLTMFLMFVLQRDQRIASTMFIVIANMQLDKLFTVTFTRAEINSAKFNLHTFQRIPLVNLVYTVSSHMSFWYTNDKINIFIAKTL